MEERRRKRETETRRLRIEKRERRHSNNNNVCLQAEVAPMAVSRSISSRDEKMRGMTLARMSMRTPMTLGKMSAVVGESLSAHSAARQTTG